MKLADFKGLFKKRSLLIQNISNPSEDYYVVQMKMETPFKWQPGEHGIFKLPGQKVEGKAWRAFSVSTVDSENIVQVAFRTGEKTSSFKQHFIQMKQGDKVEVRGPFGWFKVLDKKSPIVMVANGVGVTPIRALMKSLEHDTSRDVQVVYASSGYHLFGDELTTLSEQNTSMNLIKTQSRQETLDQYSSLAKQYGNQAYYYISGSAKAINSIKEQLTELGVNKKRIINDPFLGY